MRRMLTMVMVMAAMTLARRCGSRRRRQGSRRRVAPGRDQAGQGAAREVSGRRPGVHARRRTDRDEGAVHRQRHEGAVALPGDGAERDESAHLRQDGGAWGLVDVTPGKGETYRTRTLEVYTQNASGMWQMSQKESVRVPMK